MFRNRSFWWTFGVVFVVISIACMVVSFFYGLLLTFLRYSIYAAIAAFIIAIFLHKKRGGT